MRAVGHGHRETWSAAREGCAHNSTPPGRSACRALAAPHRSFISAWLGPDTNECMLETSASSIPQSKRRGQCAVWFSRAGRRRVGDGGAGRGVGRCRGTADGSGGDGRHPQDQARCGDHAGEPLLRLVLRDLSRSGRYTDEARHTDGVRARLHDRCVRASRSPIMRMSTAEAPTARSTRLRTSTAGQMDGFVDQAMSADRGCTDPTDPACANSAAPDVMGYHTAARHPQLLGLREALRAPRPHVRTERVVESPGAPVRGLGMVGALHRQQSDELRQRPAGPRQPRPMSPARRIGFATPPPIYAWTDLTYLLHQHHVSWGYYVVAGAEPDCERRRRTVLRAGTTGREDPGYLEPVAVLRHRPGRRATRQHPIGGELLHRREDRHAAVSLLGRAVRCGQRTSPGTRQRRAVT